jgi:cyclopropane fatty-acyl-phospholipid synthase-like methyltransferase
MSDISFNNYGKIAKLSNSQNNYLALLGRGRKTSSTLKKRIFRDIRSKIDLKKNDKILDIGCADCEITKYYKKYTPHIDAIDHKEIVKKCKKKYNFINFYEGSFLRANNFYNNKYDKIVAYSVVSCLSNISEFHQFVKKAIRLLNPGGRLLIGDIPNVSKKNRFKKSPFFTKIDSIWNKKKKIDKNSPFKDLSVDNRLLKLDDLKLIKIIKKYNSKNTEMYYLNQDNLYLSNTRIDLLVKKIS